MFDFQKMIRQNIASLQSYSSARSEFTGKADIYLDANENPFGNFNRYPDPMQIGLKKKLAELKQIAVENIFIGNGSDESIDLCFRIFCDPKRDAAMTFAPTYGMYEVSAAINDVEIIKVDLDANFQIDTKKVLEQLSRPNLKVVFICSPNNPTGNTITAAEFVIENFNGIVVVDEAYIDFSSEMSSIGMLPKYPNLIVLQTLSKAFGLAAARIGMAFASKEIIAIFNKVKPPYNTSSLNQEAAINVLENYKDISKQRDLLIEEREKLSISLQELKIVRKVYPSEANFLLIQFENNNVFDSLIAQKIIVRNRNLILKNHVRITIGTPQENTILLNILKKIR